jgi:putative transposase
MQHLELLTYRNFYHIYNRGINSCDLFNERTNFEFFLRLYDKHITPVADTYAWALMKNHFHLLIKIKDEAVDFQNPQGFENLEGLRSTMPYQSFSNLFNAYTKAFNKKYKRTGSLFEHPFKRKLINDKEYLKTMVVYIHNNPVHHGFTELSGDYPWSSYNTCISDKPSRIERYEVIGWFGNEVNFQTAHKNHNDEIEIEKWIGL